MAPFHQSAYIAGCVRNCGDYLLRVFNNIDKLTGLFNEWKIVMIYDESVDSTLPTLMELKSRYGEKLQIIQNPFLRAPQRTQNISNARNTFMDIIYGYSRENNYMENGVVNPNARDFFGDKVKDYFIWIDCDDVGSHELDVGLVAPFIERTDWDCLTFNRPIYYDLWALSVDPYVVSCWDWGDKSLDVGKAMCKFITSRLKSLRADELLECYSAFNGFGIYRTPKFVGCAYTAETEFIQTLPRESVNKCIREFGKVPYMRTQTEYRENCEHRAFHREAREKNGARIRISPIIIWKS